MRSRWSDVADEMTPRTVEDDERALARAAVALGRGHDISRDTTGTRCPVCRIKPHPQAVQCCGRELRHG